MMPILSYAKCLNVIKRIKKSVGKPKKQTLNSRQGETRLGFYNWDNNQVHFNTFPSLLLLALGRIAFGSFGSLGTALVLLAALLGWFRCLLLFLALVFELFFFHVVV